MRPKAQKLHKNIILRNGYKYILALIIAAVFLAASIWVQLYWTAAFWGLLIFGAAFPYLHPGISVFFLNSKKYQRHFTTLFSQDGIFSYTDKGFRIHTETKSYEIDWLAVQAIFVYRAVDGYIGPQDYMDIFCDNSIRLTLSEDTPGWIHFLAKIDRNLSIKEKDWHSNMDELKSGELKLLYEREGRYLARAKMIYY